MQGQVKVNRLEPAKNLHHHPQAKAEDLIKSNESAEPSKIKQADPLDQMIGRSLISAESCELCDWDLNQHNDENYESYIFAGGMLQRRR